MRSYQGAGVPRCRRGPPPGSRVAVALGEHRAELERRAAVALEHVQSTREGHQPKSTYNAEAI